MEIVPYQRKIPYGEDQLEEIGLQYFPRHRQLRFIFYYRNGRFELVCGRNDAGLAPLRVINHFKKDDRNLRNMLLLVPLNERIDELFAALSEPRDRFEAFVSKHFLYKNEL